MRIAGKMVLNKLRDIFLGDMGYHVCTYIYIYIYIYIYNLYDERLNKVSALHYIFVDDVRSVTKYSHKMQEIH